MTCHVERPLRSCGGAGRRLAGNVDPFQIPTRESYSWLFVLAQIVARRPCLSVLDHPFFHIRIANVNHRHQTLVTLLSDGFEVDLLTADELLQRQPRLLDLSDGRLAQSK